MAKGIRYYQDEYRHRAHAAARWTGGTALKQGFNYAVGAGAATVALETETALMNTGLQWHQVLGRTVGTYGKGIAGIAIGSVIKFYLNHKEMQHQNHQLMNYYRHELAAKLNKKTSDVQDADLELYARQNPTFQEELDRNRQERNFHTVIWGLAAIVSTAAVVSALVATMTALSVTTLGLPMILAVSFGVGIPVQLAAEHVFEYVGNKITGLEKKTTMERIGAIHQDQTAGHTISQERVMAVYVSASPDLQETIKRDLGKSYHHLSIGNQHEAILKYGESFGLADMTNAINDRRVSAKELAFAVHGDRSNAYPEPRFYDQVKEQAHRLKMELAKKRQMAAEKWDHVSHQLQDKKAAVMEKLSDTKEQWVSKLGFAPKAAQGEEQGWADRVTANTNTPIVGMG